MTPSSHLSESGLSQVDVAIDRLLADRRMYQAECQTLRSELQRWQAETRQTLGLLHSATRQIEGLLEENERLRRLAAATNMSLLTTPKKLT